MKYLALAAVLAALSLSVPAAQAAEAKPAAAAAKPAAKKSSAPKAAAKPAAKKASAAKPAAKKASAPKAAAKPAPAKPAAAAKPTAAKSKTAKTKDKDAGKTPAPKPADAASAAASADTLTPEELEIASRVYVGKIDCELGASVLVAADAAHPGFFSITADKRTFYMHPVHSRTGAVRLEDGKHEAMFLQLFSKSMLMDQKAGRRVADECKSPEQTAFTAEMKKNPPPNLLDAPKAEPPPAPKAQAASAAASAPDNAPPPAPEQAASAPPSQAVPLKDLPPLPEDAAAQTATPPSLPSSGANNAESLP